MPEALPGVLLVAMIVLTLVLLPHLQDEGTLPPTESGHSPDAINLRQKRHGHSPERQ